MPKRSLQPVVELRFIPQAPESPSPLLRQIYPSPQTSPTEPAWTSPEDVVANWYKFTERLGTASGATMAGAGCTAVGISLWKARPVEALGFGILCAWGAFDGVTTIGNLTTRGATSLIASLTGNEQAQIAVLTKLINLRATVDGQEKVVTLDTGVREMLDGRISQLQAAPRCASR